MKLRVHLARLSRAPMQGDLILRRLLGLDHREIIRGGQPWIEVTNLTPGQCAGYRGLFRSRKLPESTFQLLGTPAELSSVEQFAKEVEEES